MCPASVMNPLPFLVGPFMRMASSTVSRAREISLLTPAEFTKFVVLMRDLAPYLVLLIDPANKGSRRQDRNPPICRKNLELILFGCPDGRPLFLDHGRTPEMPLHHPLDLGRDRFRGVASRGNMKVQRDIA
jgi:hypothetical protein